MIIGIEHIGISANDPKAMVAWYEKHLGARTIRAMEERKIYFIMMGNGVILEIYPATQVAPAQINTASGIRHIAFLVKDIEATQREMMENGVDIDKDIPPMADTRLIHFRDCEGNLLDIVERVTPLV